MFDVRWSLSVACRLYNAVVMSCLLCVVRCLVLNPAWFCLACVVWCVFVVFVVTRCCLLCAVFVCGLTLVCLVCCSLCVAR